MFLCLGGIFGFGLLLFSSFLSHLTFRGFRLSRRDLLLRQLYLLFELSLIWITKAIYVCAQEYDSHKTWMGAYFKKFSINRKHSLNKQEYKVQRRIKINNDGTASDGIHDPFHDYDDDKWRLVSLMSNVHRAEQDLMEFLVIANDFAGWLMKEKKSSLFPRFRSLKNLNCDLSPSSVRKKYIYIKNLRSHAVL